MTRFQRMIAAAVLMAWALGLLAGQVQAVTIYVNGTNTSAVTNGLTPETGWTTISNGLIALSNANLIVKGGHMLIVGPGTYKQQVSLVDAHSGVAGTYNSIQARGDVIIDGENAARDGISFAAYCYWIDVAGFKVTRCGGWGVNHQSSSYDHSISNITVYGCRNGIVDGGGNHDTSRISYCTVVGNELIGVASSRSGGIAISNSIIAFNGIGAYEPSANRLALRNCVLYGNGVPFIASNTTVLTTKAAIEALTNPSYPAIVSTGLVMEAPGYLGLGTNLDLTRVYAGSPIFTAASDGGCVGALPAASYTTVAVPVTGYTYYVATAPTGDDTRDTNAAQSASTPWATLGRAIQSVKEGDTVMVAAGTYPGGFAVTNNGARCRPIVFQASGGQAVINGAGQFAAMTMSGVNTISFEGFAFTGATHGVVLTNVYVSGFTNCAFRDNAQDGINASFSAGITFQSCAMFGNGYRGANLYADSKATCQAFSFFDCNIYSNRPSNSSWGVVDAQAAWCLTMDRCRIFDNNVNVNTSSGINLYAYANGNRAGFFSIRNCAIYRNNRGIYLYYSTPGGVIDNCTIYGNREAGVVDGSGVNLGFPTIRNTVIASNGTYGAVCTIYGIPYQYCCFKDNVTANFRKSTAPAADLFTAAEINASFAGNTNNIVPDANLAFKNAATGDFRPNDASPLIDVGMTNTPWATDLNGNRRLVHRVLDIGANEWQIPKGTILSIY